MERFLVLARRNVPAVRMYPFGVIPRHPFHRGYRHIHDVFPASAEVDEFLLVETVQRFGSCIVIRVTFAADRTGGADLVQPLGVPDRRVLHTAIGMMNQAIVDAAT